MKALTLTLMILLAGCGGDNVLPDPAALSIEAQFVVNAGHWYCVSDVDPRSILTDVACELIRLYVTEPDVPADFLDGQMSYTERLKAIACADPAIATRVREELGVIGVTIFAVSCSRTRGRAFEFTLTAE